ncbi:MAG TPA: peptidoglycan-binding domain-containing protein [Kouleothrix sp.]|uniref:peptidoglycan-binding domain-containing protein n=1 Tax=Kouleothrix sp. TaxID=2779161 RepID=UPI002B750121|nr:peptidoglycan-binding domain-containing protein [Kouleothrix sp.]HRC76347.1 peptidoglycan-binding domain-containing protein [Kouleothrix sp.]
MEGDDVRAVQERLLGLGYPQVGKADGVFGPNTAAAVRAFQAESALDVDGIVGLQTWARLFAADAAASAIHPIVDADSGWLLGGVRAGQWLNAQDTAAGMHGGERYYLFSNAGSSGSATGGLPQSASGPCSDLLLDVALAPAPTITGTIGLAAGWNALPRAIAEEAVDTPAARKAVAEVLRAQGIAAPDVRLTRVLRADLEGDGVEETIIAATRYADTALGTLAGGVAAGDYSLVVVSRTANGRTETVPVVAEYYPKAQEISPFENNLYAALDLSGDGQLDLVIESVAYEARNVSIYSLVGGKPQRVAEAFCGI